MLLENNVMNKNSLTWAHSAALTHWGRDEIDAIFADDICTHIFLNEHFKIPLRIVFHSLIDNKPALVQITWHRVCDKPFSEQMMAQFPEPYRRHSAIINRLCRKPTNKCFPRMNTCKAGQNAWHFVQDAFTWKCQYYDQNFTEICFWMSRWQQVSSDLSIGLALNKQKKYHLN